MLLVVHIFLRSRFRSLPLRLYVLSFLILLDFHLVLIIVFVLPLRHYVLLVLLVFHFLVLIFVFRSLSYPLRSSPDPSCALSVFLP